MEENKVSVIMSCYNAGKTLKRAMQSVLGNTYKNIELVLVDDCSTDDSLQIATSIANGDCKVKIIKHKENLGAGISRRDGIANSSGEYTCFCDSDDELLPNHVSNLVNASLEHDADIVTSGYTVIEGDGSREVRKTDKTFILENESKYAVLKEDVLRFLNPSLVRRKLWDKVTYSDRRYVEDSPTLIRLIWYANKRVVLPESTYLYYQNPSSLTHTCDQFKNTLFQTLCVMDTYHFFHEEVLHPELMPDKAIVYKMAEYLCALPSSENKTQYKNEIQEVKHFMIDYYEKKFE